MKNADALLEFHHRFKSTKITRFYDPFLQINQVSVHESVQIKSTYFFETDFFKHWTAR
jgi:hypothetical protein